MQQASDFREESLTLKSLIADLDDAAFEKTTQFKSGRLTMCSAISISGIRLSWSRPRVMRHSPYFEGVGAHMMKGGSLPE